MRRGEEERRGEERRREVVAAPRTASDGQEVWEVHLVSLYSVYSLYSLGRARSLGSELRRQGQTRANLEASNKANINFLIPL